MAAHNDIGAFGEALTRQTLAQVAPVSPSAVADMAFRGVEIEVKTAKPSLYNGKTLGYQFKLRDPGHTDFTHADVLVLICLDDNLDPVASYVLPTSYLPEMRTKITIPLNLRSPFNIFRERWDVIADVYVQRWGTA